MNIHLKAASTAVGIVGGFVGAMTGVALLCKFFGWGAGAFYLIIALLFITGGVFMGVLEQLKRIEREKAREERDAGRSY